MPLLVTEHFSDLADPRVERAQRHTLLDILVVALCAVLCGADTFVDIARFGRAKQGWLQQRLGLELSKGIPSHDTFGRVFARLDPDAFGACFRDWTQALHTQTAGQIVALDGKMLRHSFDGASGRGAIHMVSAWAGASGLVLGQVKVDDKSNEITALPLLYHRPATSLEDARPLWLRRDGGRDGVPEGHRRSGSGAGGRLCAGA